MPISFNPQNAFKARSLARSKLGARNSIQVFHMGVRVTSTLAVACCLPGSAWIGGWTQDWIQIATQALPEWWHGHLNWQLNHYTRCSPPKTCLLIPFFHKLLKVSLQMFVKLKVQLIIVKEKPRILSQFFPLTLNCFVFHIFLWGTWFLEKFRFKERRKACGGSKNSLISTSMFSILPSSQILLNSAEICAWNACF